MDDAGPVQVEDPSDHDDRHHRPLLRPPTRPRRHSLLQASSVMTGYNQSSLPGSILSSKNSHTHAGSASNCTFSTKQGTGLDEIIQQNPQWYWCSFMRGILNVLLQAEIFEHTKLLTINDHWQVIFLKCLVLTMTHCGECSPQNKLLAGCSLVQTLHVYDYFCY